MPATWYIVRDGKQHGPVSELEFRKLIELGHLKETDFVWHEGAPDWMPAAQVLQGPALTAPAEAFKPQSAPRTVRADMSSTRPRASSAASGRRPARWGRVVVAAVVSGLLAAGFGVFGKVAVDKVFETLGRFKVDRASIEQRLQADPKMRWLQVLKDKQPATYAAFVDALLARVKGDVQEPFEQSIGYLRKTFVQPIFNANAPHLDDEAMTRYMSLVADQMEHFSAKNPRLCVLMLRDEPFGDARPYLTESLVAQELQLLEDALKVDKSTPRPIYSQAEQARLMAVVMAQLTRQHGDLVQLMDPSTPVAGRERDVCTVGAALFRQIASLTAPQSATLMRSLLSAQK